MRRTHPPAAPPSADEAPAAWRPPERSCSRVTRACKDAGGFASPAARRAAMTKPYPRRNVHKRARTKRAGSGAPEQHGSSRRDAATPQQDLTPRTQPQTNQDRVAGGGASCAIPGTPHACSRTPRQERAIRTAAGVAFESRSADWRHLPRGASRRCSNPSWGRSWRCRSRCPSTTSGPGRRCSSSLRWSAR